MKRMPISKPSNHSTLDPENRLTGAAGFTYGYDADGDRVEKSNGTTGTLYFYMLPGIVAESDLSGNLTAKYVFFDGERVARKDFPSGAVSYYFSDFLKSASVITDSVGNIKAESDYLPYGLELLFANKYLFGGHELDAESGNYYYGAREYSPFLGRFPTPDAPLRNLITSSRKIARRLWSVSMSVNSTSPSYSIQSWGICAAHRQRSLQSIASILESVGSKHSHPVTP